MFKEYIKQQLADAKSPTEYIYKLGVMRSEINDLITEFDNEYEWCIGCQGYSKVNEATETIEDGRTVLRCRKCNNILMIKH